MTIISHSKKFIYLKIPKTAGTTTEMYLSCFCDPTQGDLITRLHPSVKNKFTHIESKQKNGHMNIKEIIEFLNTNFPDENIWNNYYKFTIIRNPWDFFISIVYYNYQTIIYNPPANVNIIRRMVYNLRHKIIKNISVKLRINNMWMLHNQDFTKTDMMSSYIIDKELGLSVDKVMRYENLKEDMAEVCNHLNIPWEGEFIINGKKIAEYKGIRKDYRHYREVFSAAQARRIGKIYKEFNERFGYKY